MRFLELKIPPLLLMILLAGLMYWSRSYFPASALDLSLRSGLLFLCLATGITITLLGALAFKKAQTTVNPTKPETSSALVSLGIYKVTRNPMYVGMTLALIGWAFFINSPVSLIFVLAFVLYMTQFQIKPEERILSELFKQEYLDYCAKVNRWL